MSADLTIFLAVTAAGTLTRDQVVGLVCIVAGLLVPAAVIAWASARETLREARERWGR